MPSSTGTVVLVEFDPVEWFMGRIRPLQALGTALLIVAALVGLVALVVVTALPFLSSGHRGQATRMNCLSNLKRLASASLLYAADNDGKLMQRDRWLDQLEQSGAIRIALGSGTYDQASLLELELGVQRCPHLIKEGLGGPGVYGYAMDSRLSKALVAEVETPSSTVLIFESINLARNASDPFQSFAGSSPIGDARLPRPFVAYADGHVRGLMNPPAY